MVLGLSSRPTIKVQLQEDVIYVSPAAFHPDSPALGKDPLLTGLVQLTLPSPRAMSKLKVILEGLTDVKGGDGAPYESSTTLHKELLIDLRGETLTAGTHAWNFSFIVPHTTPVFQRSSYGRTRNSVRASASFVGALASSIKSPEVPIFIIATPAGSGDVPAPTDLTMESFSEDLGPVGVGFASPHLTVASLISCRVKLLATPPGQKVTITSVQGVVHQRHSIHYRSGQVIVPNDKRVVLRKVNTALAPTLTIPHCAGSCNDDFPERQILNGPSLAAESLELNPMQPLLTTDPSPLAELGPEQQYSYTATLRVPDSDVLRPSTLEGGAESLVISHTLGVEIRYLVQGETEKIFSISKDVVLGSCCQMVDSVFLPVYSESGPDASQATVKPVMMRCHCNITLKEMVERDGELLRAAAGSRGQPFGADAILARSNKSPSSFQGTGAIPRERAAENGVEHDAA